MRIVMVLPLAGELQLTNKLPSLAQALTRQGVPTTVLPSLDQQKIEQKLLLGQRRDLLVEIFEQCQTQAAHAEILLVAGLPIQESYAAELNTTIANALNATVLLWIGPTEIKIPASNATKIIAQNYRETLAGIVAEQVDLPTAQAFATANSLPLLALASHQHDTSPISSEVANGLELCWPWQFLATPPQPRFTPAMFRHHLFTTARAARQKIVLPEGTEPRTLLAVKRVTELGIADIVLLGNPEQILAEARQQGIQFNDHVTLIDPNKVAERYIEPLYNARRNKGMTLDLAAEQLKNPVMLGTMMLFLDEADGLVSGAVHSTADTIRPALQIIRTAPDAQLVSSVFFICLPNQVLVYGDCAINPDPTAEELANIAIQSAKTAESFGIEPRVAMLSYSTGTSGCGPTVEKVKLATQLVRSAAPHLLVDGPLQYDAAVDWRVAQIKAPESPVAGRATVLIMPDLNVGNIAYKAVQQSTGIVCVGPMLQGLRKPVNDLSRGCTVEDIISTIAMTAVQAGKRSQASIKM